MDPMEPLLVWIDEIWKMAYARCGNTADAGQKPVGLCGSGIIDIISELYRVKAINASVVSTE